jgi:hypothetical protein
VTDEVWTDDSVEFTLEQSRFLSDGSAATNPDILWCIPLLFSTSGSESTEAVVMDQKVQTFAVPLIGAKGKDNWLKINTNQRALCRVHHSTQMVERLTKAIAAGELNAIDRSGVLQDGYTLAEAGLAPLESVGMLLRSLEGETNSTVWSAISMALGTMHKMLETLGEAWYFWLFD